MNDRKYLLRASLLSEVYKVMSNSMYWLTALRAFQKYSKGILCSSVAASSLVMYNWEVKTKNTILIIYITVRVTNKIECKSLRIYTWYEQAKLSSSNLS